ncbi:TBC1 domain family member 20-like isoform X3 [Chelonoidis abingdonii]|uniref:TBC1 domain family member 20-like isoform X3 n=1 Tax=Chelonoidis abingdonii TaxID=106734 RepID=UPI003F49869D
MACPLHSQRHVSSAFDCPSPMDRVPASQLDELEGAVQCKMELNLQPSGLQLDTSTPQRQRDRELPEIWDTLQGCNFTAGREMSELLCGTSERTRDGRAGELSEPNRTGGLLGSKRKRKLLLIHQALTSDPVAVETLRGAAGCPPEPQGLHPSAAGREPLHTPLPPRAGARGELPASEGMRAEQRQVLQEQLIDLILHILRAHPELHYYQGYHDIALTLLLLAGERMGSALLAKLSTHHLRDFMDPTMDSTKHILNYLMPILQRESLRLHDFMLRAEVGTIFALSWLITWYGHVLTSFPHILRLYDFFLASHPLMPVYFAAVIVLHREADVLACDCDMPSVHQLLSRIPQNLPYERLISRALQLFQCHPHAELAKQAALQHHKSISIGSFSAFQLATTQQRPDAVLRRQRQQDSAHAEAAALLPTAGHSPLVKAAVWGISATLGAAALAVTQTALEWAPEFLLQLF